MNAARFFELAHKVIEDRATDNERADLAVMMARNPMLKEELELLRKEARAEAETAAKTGAAKDEARPRPPPELTEDARWRSETGSHREKRFYQRWRWWVRLAVVSIVGALLILSDYKFGPEPIIQIAITGKTPPEQGASLKEIAVFRQNWKSSATHFVAKAAELAVWEKDWPTESPVPTVKLAIDQEVRQVRVTGRSLQISFQRTFTVEKDLPTTLNEVNEFLKDQFPR